jgi:hypothetical protein
MFQPPHSLDISVLGLQKYWLGSAHSDAVTKPVSSRSSPQRKTAIENAVSQFTFVYYT